MGYLEANPLAKLKKPPKTPRQSDITREQWDTVLALIAVDDPFRDFLLFLLATGCRPQEARIIEKHHVNWTARKVHLDKVPGKKGSRDILLTDEAVALLKKQTSIDGQTDGPIFKNTNGQPWRQQSLACRFQRLKKKLPFNVHCYLTRHSAATEMLDAGASAGAVAAILGHKDATMVLKVYGKHIDQREEHLRKCLENARSAGSPKHAG